MALVMDVARFKYPSFWASVNTLWESLKPIDQETGRSRGYFILSRMDATSSLSLLKLELDQTLWPSTSSTLKQMRPTAPGGSDDMTATIQHSLTVLGYPSKRSPALLFRNFSADSAAEISERDEAQVERDLGELCNDVRQHPLHARVATALRKARSAAALDPKRFDVDAVLGTVMMLSLPLAVSPLGAHAAYLSLYHHRSPSKRLRDEIGRLRHQLASLEAHSTSSCPTCNHSVCCTR